MGADPVLPRASRHGRRRRWLRGVGMALAVVLALVLVALLALHTPPARRMVLDRLTSYLESRRIAFQAGDLRYNLADLSVELRDARVGTERWPDAPVFAVIPYARVDLSVLSLVRGRWVVESGVVQGLDVHYLVRQDGETNLPMPPPGPDEPATSEPGQPLDYLLEDVRIEDARVHYEDAGQALDVQLPIGSLTVDGNLATGRHDIALVAGPGEATYEGRRVPISSIAGDLDLGSNDIDVERLVAEAAGSRVEISGAVDDFSDPRLAMTVESRVDVRRAAAVAGVEEQLAGTIQAHVTVEGPAAAPVVRATAGGEGMTARGLAPAALSLDAGYDVATKVVSANRVSVDAPWGAVDARGTIALEQGSTSTVHATTDALDAAALMEAFGLDYRVASRVDLQADASWPALEVASASGEATVTLTPARTAPAEAVVPVAGRLQATAQDGRIVASLDQVRALGTRLDGEVRVSDEQSLGGEVQLQAGRLEQVLPAVEAFLGRPRGSLVPTPVAGRLTAHARLGGTVQSPDVTAQVSAPALAVGDVDALRLSADARYIGQSVRIAGLDVDWADARLHAEGRIGLAGRQPLDATVTAQGVRIESVLAALGRSDVPASGLVELQGVVQGTVADPQARVALTGADLAAYQEPLGQLTARAVLRGNRAELSELVLQKPQEDGTGRLAASGEYDLRSRAYSLDLSTNDLRIERLVLPDGRPVRAGVAIELNGQGTIADPAARANVTVQDLSVGDTELGAIETRIDVADRQAHVNARADRFQTALEAVIGTDGPYPAEAELRIDALPLAALPVPPDTPLDGTLTAHVTASAPLADPDTGTATITLDRLAAQWNGRPVSVDTPAVITYADRVVAVKSLTVEADQSSLTVEGRLPLDQGATPGTLSIDADVDLASAASYAPDNTPVSADGRMAVTGAVHGTLAALDPDLTLTIENGLVLSPDLEPAVTGLELRAMIRDGVARLETLTADWGAASLSVTGRAPLSIAGDLPLVPAREAAPAELAATVRGLDPGIIPGTPEGLGGLVSLDARFTAPQADLASLDGTLTFDDLRVAFNTLDLAQQGPSSIRVAGGIATVEQLDLAGSVGELSAVGTVGLTGDRPLDVQANGQIDIAAVSAVTDAVRAEGPTRIAVTAGGTVAKPDLQGTIELTDGTFAVDNPRIGAEGVHARLDLEGPRITLSALDGSINGGTFDGSGYVTLGGDVIADADLQFTTRDFAFDAPLDLRSLSNSAIRISRQGQDFVVGGTVTVEEGGLTGDIDFNTAIIGAVTAPERLDLTAERNPFLERVRFDVSVETAQPLLVDNNLAEAEVTADLRVLGTPYETGLSGRLELLEGGAVTLNERDYEIERGVIMFTDERRIAPEFDLRLNTSASRYDITLAVNGPPGDTETSLTADPTLPEPDIMALLVTGRTLDEMRGSEFAVAREQVLSYLAGGLGSRLGRGLEQATGLSEVRLEPNLIAGEEDPNARLTIAQDLTDRLKLIFSNDLVDSNNQVWVAQYDATRRFQTRAVRQVDDTYRFDFQHDVRFGGAPEPLRVPRTRPTVRTITIDADEGPGTAALRDLLDVEEGDAFDYFDARDGVQRIQRYYREHGWLQSHVRLRRTINEGHADLALAIQSGPRVDLRFEGATIPDEVREEVARQWQRGVFDSQRADDGREAIRAWLMRDGHLDPDITWKVDEDGAGRRVAIFTVDPGVRFEHVRLEFDGAQGVDPDVLRDIVSEQDLEDEVYTDPTVVTELLERYYKEQGYLDAAIDQPEYDFGGGPEEARVRFRVDEGPRFRVTRVVFEGNAAMTEAALRDETPLLAGDTYLPAVAERSAGLIRQAYWERGYNDARIRYVLDADRATGGVAVTYRVDEGVKSVVAGVEIDGADRVSEAVVRNQLALAPGDTLDLTAVGESRRNLYDTGGFSIADITRVPAGDTGDGDAGGAQGLTGTEGVKPVTLQVHLREVQPFQIRYGLSVDTERGPGGLFEVSNHNSLGHARVLGLSTRYDSQLRSARIFLSQPSLESFPLQSTVTGYVRAERNPLTELSEAFNVDRVGFSIQQEKQLGNHYVWNYGYRFEQARRWDPRPDGTLDERTTVAPLTSAFTRETRDEPLDASTGSFLSHSFSFSPEWLGSDVPFMKYYGQFFKYFPLRPPTRERLTHEILRPRLVFATGVRLGLAKGIGSDLPASERFFAGGSTTLRGFAQNAVGAIGRDGIPLGGQALFVLNNELRFPILGPVDGVTFLDIGQVYQRVSDFSLTDLRQSAGLGLRLRTPWVLIRTDYGFVLDPRDGERRSRFYFSIGQAF
ncbi:MAG: translocation/assembly module TamB domain-containing protein [Vicinamibacterales bacterium]